MNKKTRIWLEFFTIFIVVPIVIFHFRSNLNVWLLPLICLSALFCFTIIYCDSSFKRFRLTNTANINRLLWRSPLLFLIGAIMSSAFFVIVMQGELFYYVTEHTSRWVLALLLYPLFSAWPQELIFRTYFFHRYKKVMPSKPLRVFVSALVFSFAHIIYANVWAMLLSFVGGLMFAYTYAKSRSTIAVTIEHSIWGLWLFSMGLGKYLDLNQITV